MITRLRNTAVFAMLLVSLGLAAPARAADAWKRRSSSPEQAGSEREPAALSPSRAEGYQSPRERSPRPPRTMRVRPRPKRIDPNRKASKMPAPRLRPGTSLTSSS